MLTRWTFVGKVISLLFNMLSQFSSVAQSCPALCDPMNHSTPGLPVHHHFPEFTQTHARLDITCLYWRVSCRNAGWLWLSVGTKRWQQHSGSTHWHEPSQRPPVAPPNRQHNDPKLTGCRIGTFKMEVCSNTITNKQPNFTPKANRERRRNKA